jgi:hypothetical protein
MYGDHTDPIALQKIQSALENATTEQVEIGLSKKNSSPSKFKVINSFSSSRNKCLAFDEYFGEFLQSKII